MAIGLNSTSLRNLILGASSSLLLKTISQNTRKFSSKLLNIMEPDEISGIFKTKIYTEVNTNLSVGDRVYIINGYLDSNDRIKKDRYKQSNDGYRILKIDRCAITIDLDYSDSLIWEEVRLNEHIKLWSALNQETIWHISDTLIPTSSTASEIYRFLEGNNNLLYTNSNYNTIHGSISTGINILTEPSTGTFSWLNLSVNYDNNAVSAFLGTNSGNVVVIGDDFIYNNVEYKNNQIYKFNESIAVWQINHIYKPAILSKSNFRDGEFNGEWTDGIYGSYDKKISWKTRENNSWTSGILTNINWLSGEMKSDSDNIVQNSYYATYDNGLVKQSTDKSNNKGWGYNYAIDSDIYSGTIYNGNFQHTNFGSASSTMSAIDSFIQSITYSIPLSVKKGKISNANVTNGLFTNVDIDYSISNSGQFKNSNIINTTLKKSVINSSKFKADSAIKITDTISYNFITQSDPDKVFVKYKFYINESDITKLKSLSSFYLKGLKFDNLAFFDKLENVFYMNTYFDTLNKFDGTTDRGIISCEVKTGEENTWRTEADWIQGEIFGTKFIAPSAKVVKDLEKPSLDITIQYDLPLGTGFSVLSIPPPAEYNAYFDWITSFNNIDVIENPYIINVEYESGIMDSSTWEYGNFVNNKTYQIDQVLSSTLALNISIGSTTSIQLQTKSNIEVTNWLNSNITTGDVIFLDNTVFNTGVYPNNSMPESLVQYPIDGAYKVLSINYGTASFSSKIINLVAFDSDAMANLLNAYNAKQSMFSNYGSSNGFIYTYDAALSYPSDRYGKILPNFMSFSKTKINKSIIKSGIFARTFFKDSTITNDTFNNTDIIPLRTNVDNLKFINFILSSNTQNALTGYFDFTTNSTLIENRIGNNITVKAGLFYNSICINPIWTNGLLYDSYWFSGKFNNGVAKRVCSLSMDFYNGRFIDNMTYDSNGGKVSFGWKHYGNPSDPSLYQTWLSNPISPTWRSGNFYNGEMSNSIWETGSKYDGIIYNTLWYDGTHYGGDFGSDKYNRSDNTMLAGVWKNGTVYNSDIGSTWYSTLTWENGIFNGGQFIGSNDATHRMRFIDTQNIGDKLCLLMESDTNISQFPIGTKILINKYSDGLNDQYNTETLITNISTFTYSSLATYSVIETDVTFGKLAHMESGAILKNYSLWKNGTFNNGSIVGRNTVWHNGEFNNGEFNSTLFNGFDYQQILNEGDIDVGYPAYNEVRHNYNYSWRNGVFNGGVFKSNWLNGVFNGGRFEGKVWKNGVFKNGSFTGQWSGSSVNVQIGSIAASQYNLFNIPSNNVRRGLWLGGKIVDDERKLVKNEKVYSKLERRKDEIVKTPTATFKNALIKNGYVDHSGATFDNVLWADGEFKDGKFNSGSFNPIVKRYIGLAYAYAPTYSTIVLSRSDYNAYPGSDGYSQNFFLGFEESEERCVWKNGTWNNGEFYYSEWKNGIFNNGTMSGGIWNKGTWVYGDAKNILWLDGTWKNGNWYGSNFRVDQISSASGYIQEPSFSDPVTKATFYYLNNIDNKLITLGIVASSSTSPMHIYNVFTNDDLNYHPTNNTLIGLTKSVGNLTNNYYSFTNWGSWSYSHTHSAAPGTNLISHSRIGNGRFLKGTWENGVWNNGWRVDSLTSSVGYANYTEFDSVSQFVELQKNVWQFTISMDPLPVNENGTARFEIGKKYVIIDIPSGSSGTTTTIGGSDSVGEVFIATGTASNIQQIIVKPAFSDVIAGDKVSISNIVTYDINDRRRLIKGHYTVVGITSTTLTVNLTVNFPIRRILKDSDAHRIKVTKNIWLSGVFINGVFSGTWNSGLFAGLPFLSVMDKTHMIDGRFEGGHFIATQSRGEGFTYSTSLIQRMDFKDMDKSASASIHKYNSWMDVNWDTRYVSNIFLDKIFLDNQGNEYTKTNYQGIITFDILESISNMRDNGQNKFRNYNLGTKYTKYVDFMERSSEFNKPNIYSYGWTASDILGSMSLNLYQDVVVDLVPDFENESGLFINNGYLIVSPPWPDYNGVFATAAGGWPTVTGVSPNPAYATMSLSAGTLLYNGEFESVALSTTSSFLSLSPTKVYNVSFDIVRYEQPYNTLKVKFGLGTNNSAGFSGTGSYAFTQQCLGNSSFSVTVLDDDAFFGLIAIDNLYVVEAVLDPLPAVATFSNLTQLTLDGISLELGRYSMVEFDCYTWSGGPNTLGITQSNATGFTQGAMLGDSGGDMYGNHLLYFSTFFGIDVYNSSENLYFNIEPLTQSTPSYQHNPVRSNPDPHSKKMEFFYNRLDMDMYIAGSFSAILDNLKFYEVDMIPFYLYYGNGTSSINYDIQVPQTGRAPFIDYANQNFSFESNVTLQDDAEVVYQTFGNPDIDFPFDIVDFE